MKLNPQRARIARLLNGEFTVEVLVPGTTVWVEGNTHRSETPEYAHDHFEAMNWEHPHLFIPNTPEEDAQLKAIAAKAVTEEFCFICSRCTDHRGEHSDRQLLEYAAR